MLLRKWSLVAVLAGWIVPPVLGRAAPDFHPRKWEFSILAGAGSLSGRASGPTASGSGSSLLSFDYDAGYALGFGVIENLADRFGAEMRYGISNLPLTAASLTAEPATPEQAHYVHGLIYSLLVYPQGWKRGRLVPYALAGLGASLFQPSDDSEAPARGMGLKNRWKLAGELGGGVKLYLDRSWSLRYEVRDRITGVPDYGLPTSLTPADGPGAVLPSNGRLHHWQFHVGLTYGFTP